MTNQAENSEMLAMVSVALKMRDFNMDVSEVGRRLLTTSLLKVICYSPVPFHH